LEPLSLEEEIRNLAPELRAKVRDYIEYLSSQPGRAPAADQEAAPEPGGEVSLCEVTAETVREVCRLSNSLVPPKNMVAPNALSIAQAYFEPRAWFRAIYAGEVPVGFVMLYDDAEEQEYFLWRLMIAGPQQGKGYGRRAVELLVDYVRTRPGARALEVSCGQGAGSPEGFYRRLGFRRSGKMYDDEVGLVLEL